MADEARSHAGPLRPSRVRGLLGRRAALEHRDVAAERRGLGLHLRPHRLGLRGRPAELRDVPSAPAVLRHRRGALGSPPPPAPRRPAPLPPPPPPPPPPARRRVRPGAPAPR